MPQNWNKYSNNSWSNITNLTPLTMPIISHTVTNWSNSWSPSTFTSTSASASAWGVFTLPFQYEETLTFTGENIDLMIGICRDKNLALLNIHHDDENVRKLCERIMKKKEDKKNA
jgi:hypothetical protein